MFRKPDNILTGTWAGIKGGALELASGISGIFTKPYEGVQKEGVAGLFKGIGKGLLGAVTSPVTAALKIGTSITQGIEGTVIKIGKGGISQQGRIRFPRYITPENIVVAYDDSLSEARLILNSINEKKYSGENILLFEVLPQKIAGKEPMVIITEKRLLVLARDKTVMMKAKHTQISHGQLFAEKDGRYVLQIVTKGGRKIGFESINYPIMAKCASYFPELKQQPVVARRLPAPGV